MDGRKLLLVFPLTDVIMENPTRKFFDQGHIHLRFPKNPAQVVNYQEKMSKGTTNISLGTKEEL